MLKATLPDSYHLSVVTYSRKTSREDWGHVPQFRNRTWRNFLLVSIWHRFQLVKSLKCTNFHTGIIFHNSCANSPDYFDVLFDHG